MLILDGKALANKYLQYIQKEIKADKLSPLLLIFLIGDDPASQIFVRAKAKVCNDLGVNISIQRLEINLSEKDLRAKVNSLIKDINPDGVIIQLPLPNNFNIDNVLKCIPPSLDVDHLNNGPVKSPVVLAISALLAEYKIQVQNKKVVVVGAGRLVGKPVASLMGVLGAKVTVCDIRTKNLEAETKAADILITGVGQKGLITDQMLKKGVAVIDAGTCYIDGKVYGDVDSASIQPIASCLAPVPGGIGPMTIAMLLMNLLALIKRKI